MKVLRLDPSQYKPVQAHTTATDCCCCGAVHTLGVFTADLSLAEPGVPLPRERPTGVSIGFRTAKCLQRAKLS
jgi:hypothetical protein